MLEHPPALVGATAEVDLVDERLRDRVSVIAAVAERTHGLLRGDEIEPEQPVARRARSLHPRALEGIPIRLKLGGDPLAHGLTPGRSTTATSSSTARGTIARAPRTPSTMR